MREPSEILKCLEQKRQLTLQRLTTKEREEKAIHAYKQDCQAKIKTYDEDKEKIIAAMNVLQEMGAKYNENFLMQVFGEGDQPKPTAILLPPPTPPEVQATILANEEVKPPVPAIYQVQPHGSQPRFQQPLIGSAHKAGNHPCNPNRDRTVSHSAFQIKVEAAVFTLLGAYWKDDDCATHKFVLQTQADHHHLQYINCHGLLADSLFSAVRMRVLISNYYRRVRLCYHWGIFFLDIFSRIPEELALVVKLPHGRWELTERGVKAVVKRDIPHLQLLAKLHAGMIDGNLDGIGRSRGKAIEIAEAVTISEEGVRRACDALNVKFRPDMLVKPVLQKQAEPLPA